MKQISLAVPLPERSSLFISHYKAILKDGGRQPATSPDRTYLLLQSVKKCIEMRQTLLGIRDKDVPNEISEYCEQLQDPKSLKPQLQWPTKMSAEVVKLMLLAAMVVEVTSQTVRPMENLINVRTVLFSDADTCRMCWSKADLQLLIARRFAQDLIPRRIPRDFGKLLNYFNHLLDSVKCKADSRTAGIVQKAIMDGIGGYLHAVGIPVLNEAYYAGNVDYKTTSRLHGMLGTIMARLGTNGAGWAPPCDMSHIATKVSPLPLKTSKNDTSCNVFVIPNMKSNTNGTYEDVCPDAVNTEPKIQIPFLDDNSYPSAIAVPLRDHPLFSLMSECSANIIPTYYILAMRCLTKPPFTKTDVIVFNKALHRWIITSVVPHLHETTRWYPGFGSVMRVVETMNQRGLASSTQVEYNQEEDKQYSPSDLAGNLSLGPDDSPCFMTMPPTSSFLKYLLIAAIALILLLLLCFLLYWCCLYIKKRKQKKKECEISEESEVPNPYVNIYCGLKTPQASFKDPTGTLISSRGSTSQTTDPDGSSSDVSSSD